MDVILDANIILAFLLSRGFIVSSIFNYWDNNAFTLLYSDEILEEYILVLDRLEALGKIKKRNANSLLKKITKKGKKINIVSKLNVSPDLKDNRYIECAKDGRANYLVSRDGNDLLAIGRYEYTKIISALELLNVLKSKDIS
jgi:putative PIN family toxin of toxin-antitoxin system